jgi:flagellar biosynthesis chaperone FliJ
VNTKGFSDEQKSALLDLLILGMYQDRHIAAAEDERVKSLVASFDLPSDYARQQFIDASFARVNKQQRTPEALRSAVFNYGSKFTDAKQRRQALDALAELLASDSQVTNEENRFLIMVEEAFELKKP